MKNTIKLSTFLFFGSLLLAILYSCSKDNNELEDMYNDDADLISAIQDATQKSAILFSELPQNAQEVINSTYTESYPNQIYNAVELGYEVELRKQKGSRVGEIHYTYFDSDGNELATTNVFNGKRSNGEDDKGRKDCFSFELPITYTMPDGTTLIIEVEGDWENIKDWYDLNPDSEERPTLAFPVVLIFEDSTTITVNSAEELKAVHESCREGREVRNCYKFVLPVTYKMPDGTELVISDTAGWVVLKDWYNENPDAEIVPELVFPVDVEFRSGEIVTVSSVEELGAVGEWCHKNDRKRKHRKCFEFEYPITKIMPDGTEIEITENGDYDLIKAWYEANPDVDERPTLKYPVTVIFNDTSLIVNNEDEMLILKENCKELREERRCFIFVYPLTWIMPDGTTIELLNEDEKDTIKEWYEANPDVEERPELSYPIEIAYDDENIVTINSKEELMLARKECHKENGRGKGKGGRR